MAAVDGSATGRDARWGWWLALIGVAALVGRVAYVLLVTRHGDLGREGDAFSYSVVAGNLRPGHWFVDPFTGRAIADHPPLTAILLAPVTVLSDSVVAQRLTMAVVGALAVVVIGLVGRSVAGPRAGLAAAAVAACNPNLWVNDGLVMSESLSTLLIAVVLLAGFALAREPSWSRTVVAAIACGAAVLTRAEVGLFIPLMVVPILATKGDLQRSARLGRMAAAAGCALLVVLPWSAWNTTRFEEPVVVSTNDGTVLAGANCPTTFNGEGIGGWSIECVAAVPTGGATDASLVSSAQRRTATSFVRANLNRLPLVVLAREGRVFGLWQPGQMAEANQSEGRRPWASWLGFGAFWLLAIPSILGARQVRRSGVTLIPFTACLVSTVAVVALTHGLPRLRLPLDVAMCVLTGVAVSWVVDRRARSRHPDPVPASPQGPS